MINVYGLAPSTPEVTRECKFFYLETEHTYRFKFPTIALLKQANDVFSAHLSRLQEQDLKMVIPGHGEFTISNALLADVARIWVLCEDSNETNTNIDYFLALAFIAEPAYIELIGFIDTLVNEWVVKNAISLAEPVQTP